MLELLVTLVIMSILASVAFPYAELTVRRNKELELRHALREMRTAIDEFHNDWKNGKIPRNSSYASDDGYPVSLEVLVNGIDSGKTDGRKRYYLRKIPHNPFTGGSQMPEMNFWLLRGYQDPPNRLTWNGKDVYDIHSPSTETAIDGSLYREW